MIFRRHASISVFIFWNIFETSSASILVDMWERTSVVVTFSTNRAESSCIELLCRDRKASKSGMLTFVSRSLANF